MLEFLSFMSQSYYGINMLDVLIVAVVLFYAREGFVLGFTLAALDLVSFLLSFVGALKFYFFAATFLSAYFSLPVGFSNAIGFFITAFVLEIVLSILFRKLLKMAPGLPAAHPVVKALKKGDHAFGIFPGIISAFIVLTFLLTVIVSLPSSPLVKQLVDGSVLGSHMVANSSLFEKRLNGVFGGALDETLNFMTVKPQSNETVKLNYVTSKGIVDPEAEQEMFRSVNTQRSKAGLPPLAFDDQLREVGRAHSQDMFIRGYFSHYTPEGLSPFDRMTAGGIVYTYAGENLALAPSTSLAMQGLMDSPGHRANILSPNFGKIGIGVIDGGIYGKMYSQEFTN